MLTKQTGGSRVDASQANRHTDVRIEAPQIVGQSLKKRKQSDKRTVSAHGANVTSTFTEKGDERREEEQVCKKARNSQTTVARLTEISYA